jgi:2,4-dienoyl-CoA reductase-like NADH-dependent reductase (Old Yellow Enzyme family)
LLRPKRPYPVPRELTLEEIAEVVEAYRKGAENAKRAGFDGVELHGANGYLLDQFLQDSSNKRADAYGGPIENRARLMLEAVDAAISVFGPERVGLHLAPRGDAHDMGDSDLSATFTYVARAMRERGLAFLMARERVADDRIGPQLKAEFGGVFIANEGLDPATAQALLDAGEADAVGFGKLFISNPDLPARIQAGAPLARWVAETFYTPGPEGYVDYPPLELQQA